MISLGSTVTTLYELTFTVTSNDCDQNWAPDDMFEWPDEAPTDGIQTPQQLVQTCRDYLLLVANRNLDRELQGKLGASDLVQETFVRAQRNFKQFRGSSIEEFLTWLRQILLNHLVDETPPLSRRGEEADLPRAPAFAKR